MMESIGKFFGLWGGPRCEDWEPWSRGVLPSNESWEGLAILGGVLRWAEEQGRRQSSFSRRAARGVVFHCTQQPNFCEFLICVLSSSSDFETQQCRWGPFSLLLFQ
jgi:hypothetical protein